MPFILAASMGAFTISSIFGIFGIVMLQKAAFAPLPVESPLPFSLKLVMVAGGIIGLLLGVLGGVIAYAIRHEREWSRDAIILWWAASCAGAFCFSASVGGVGSNAAWAMTNPMIGGIASVWYLYRKPNVVRYFAILEERTTAGTIAPQRQ